MFVGGRSQLDDCSSGELKLAVHPAVRKRAQMLPFFTCLASVLVAAWWVRAENLAATPLPLRPAHSIPRIPSAPPPPRVSTELRTGTLKPGERLTGFLLRHGVGGLDAATADRLATAEGELPAATRVTVELLPASHGSARDLQRLVVKPEIATTITISRQNDMLTVTRNVVPVDKRPLRLRGSVGSDLRASLRMAGASLAEADSFISALRERVPLGELKPSDRFDMMVAVRSTPGGEVENGPLLYVGLERAGGGYLQLVPLGGGRSSRWIDAASNPSVSRHQSMIQPVNARISSGFGVRVHPILRFLRLHRGVDYAAPAGTPVSAAARGVIVRAGWAGGYGNQVRIAHPDGSQTSYSHLSSIKVMPGQSVFPGQQVGRVGSTGLSTGPHLHFELYRNGAAVDPLLTRIATNPSDSASSVEAARSRMLALLSVPYRERRIGA